jgi:uncharacterized membrane protein YfcA
VTPDTLHILTTGVILFLGSLLQGAAGFGFGLLVVPLLLWTGMPLPQAVAVTVAAALVQSANGTWHLRQHVHWRVVVNGVMIRTVGLVGGILLLGVLANLPQDRIKQVIGIVILAAVIVQRAWHVHSREHVAPVWTVTAFLSSGLLAGMFAMGGPPLVLWVMAHRWTAQDSRAVLLACFMLALVPHMPLMYARFGSEVLMPFAIGLAYSPLIMLSAWLGVGFGNRFSKDQLRLVTTVLLVVIALRSILEPML